MTEGTITPPINKIVSLSLASVLPCLVLVCVLAIFPFSCSWAAAPDSMNSSGMNSSEFGPREMPQNSHAAFDDPAPSTALAKGQATFHPELIAPAAGDDTNIQQAEGDQQEGDEQGDAQVNGDEPPADEEQAAPPPEPIDQTPDGSEGTTEDTNSQDD